MGEKFCVLSGRGVERDPVAVETIDVNVCGAIFGSAFEFFLACRA